MKLVIVKGGLGNQMFQYALFLSLKDKKEKKIIDLSFFKSNNSHNGYELHRIFKINNENIVDKKLNLLEKIFRKIKRKVGLEKVIVDNFKYQNFNFLLKERIIFDGYWQSEKYFKSIENEIIKIYKFPEIKDRKNLEILERIKDKEAVSIHIRRGDYIGHPQLDGMAPLSYYESSIDYIKARVKSPIFLIFSNDIEWCKKNLPLDNENVYYVDWNIKENSFRDMQLMSLCKHNIIPNSSFSWWGAWLNQNPKKIVVAPEKWFTDNSKLPYQDIIPKSWIKIQNY